MNQPVPSYATLEDWIAGDAIPFSVDSSERLNAAVDGVIAALGPSVDLLGIGEPMHGAEDILLLRNRLFQRLVEAHGYSAIAVESSFPRGRLVNDYVAGRGPAAYEAVREHGFSHAFGRLDANRELVEWMRQYNADPLHPVNSRPDDGRHPGLRGVPRARPGEGAGVRPQQPPAARDGTVAARPARARVVAGRGASRRDVGPALRRDRLGGGVVRR